jgi:hypothetical protein
MNQQINEKTVNFRNKAPKSALSLLLDENSNGNNKKRGNESSIEFRDSFFGSFESVDSFSSYPAVEMSPKRKKSGLLNVYELISLVVEDATENNESPALSKSQKSPSKYIVMPAEEDGTPMDDLPFCSSQTDLLNFGVTDFVIINKMSSEPFAHVRIEANKGLLQDRKQDRQNTLDSEESYYILPEPGRSSSATNADAVPVFRTDTDESQHRKSLVDVKAIDPQIDASPSSQRARRSSSTKSPRHRSSSGSLVISYRCNNSERWRIAKPLTAVSPIKTTDSVGRRVKSFSHSSKKRPEIAALVTNQSELGLPRRHSERPYTEELDGGEEVYVPLNPHTSSCRLAQFSPTRPLKTEFAPETPSPARQGKTTPKGPSDQTTPPRPPKLEVNENPLPLPSNQPTGKPRQQLTSPNRSGVFAKLMDLFQSSQK